MKIFKNLFKSKKQNIENKKNFYQEEVDRYKEIGELVKEARIQQNLSIEELARISKIPERIINSLENNNKDLRPKYPFIRSIVIKLENCLRLKQNTLVKLVNKGEGEFKKNGNDFILGKYDLLNSWMGSVLYFFMLVLTIFFLKRYFISDVNTIEIQNTDTKIIKK